MKEQLPARLQGELLLFDFPTFIFFCTAFLSVQMAEDIKEIEFFLQVLCWFAGFSPASG